MSRKRILYISGSLGLGHITRDLAIAKELRKRVSGLELFWLAAHPASILLKDEGENLLPEAEFYADDNKAAESAGRSGFRLNLLTYLSSAMGEWKQNIKIFKQVITRKSFDVVVADEAYEISVALEKGHVQMDSPFVMIFDFIGNMSMDWNPVGRLMTYMWNREWAKCRSFYSNDKCTALFIGELEDVPDKKLGFFLPNARKIAEEVCDFVGYVLPFEPVEYVDNSQIRAELGYDDQPLIVCSIGGTSIGKDLLLLCGQAYTIIKHRIPDLRMVIICGPRLAAKSIDFPEGIEVKEYVPKLYRYFAACDIAVVQAGGTTTIELTALRRPFLYFPLEGHFEQQIHVSERLKRHGAGIRMNYKETTPDDLVEAVIANLGKKVDYTEIPIDGAEKAADLISRLLQM